MSRELTPGELTLRALLDAYAPPSVLVDRDGKIAYFYGRTSDYLDFPNGDPSHYLSVLARDGLREELPKALDAAARSGRDAEIGDIPMIRAGVPLRVRLKVVPLPPFGGELLLVSFFDEPGQAGSAPGPAGGAPGAEPRPATEAGRPVKSKSTAADKRIASLSKDLQALQDELQRSQTKLQRLTDTVTARRQRWKMVLDVGQNALCGMDPERLLPIAVRTLGEALTADFACVFAPSGGPEGLVLRHLWPGSSALPAIALEADGAIDLNLLFRSRRRGMVADFRENARLRSALGSLAPDLASGIAVVVDGPSGPSAAIAAYSRRSGLFTEDDLPFLRALAILLGLGAEREMAETAARTAHAFARSLIEAAREPMLIIDSTYQIVNASGAFFATFGVDREKVEGRLIYELPGEPWTRPALRSALLCVFTEGLSQDFEVEGDFPIIGHRVLRLIARRIGQGNDMVLVTMTDETEYAELGKALAEAKANTEQASAAKTHFLAAASHDLRQPLQAAHLFTAMLTTKLDEGTHRKAVDNLGSSLKSMDSLLNTLLSISKLDAGLVVADAIETPIAQALEQEISNAKAVALAKGLQLRWVPCSAWVRTDPALLAQIVQNLLSNALRYTPKGRVLVGCRRRGTRLAVQVCDSGIGIDESQLERIFAEFYQIGNDARQQANGLGLGLSIVDRLAKLIGSPVQVRSALGRGSVFTVEVPLAKPWMRA